MNTTLLTNTIINGDCLKVLPRLHAESVDFILTDPPYITRYQDCSRRSIQNGDNDVWLKPAFAEMYRVLARHSFCVNFYGWPQADRFIRGFPCRRVTHRRTPGISEALHLSYQAFTLPA